MKLVATVLALAALSGCTDQGDDPLDADPGTTLVTYYADVKPILDARCNYCHYDGGIAPFALTDYEAASANAGVAVLAVNDKIMPPWPANADCRDYLGDRSLSDAEIATLNQWLDDGAPEGDPAREGDPLPTSRMAMSRVDTTLTLPQPYTPAPASGETDDYRCFVIPWPATTTAYVTGFNAVPDNAAIVHHVLAYVAAPDHVADFVALDQAEAGPGYTCFGGANSQTDGLIGAWAPGGMGEDLPAGVGLEVLPGSAVVLQVHYNTLETTGADQTSIQFKIDEQVDRVGVAQLVTNPVWVSTLTIPANDPDVTYSFSFDPTPFTGGDVEVFAAGLHMHTLGSSGNVTILRDSGDTECLLQIDDWNFHWQGSYRFTESTVIQRGDRLGLECRWDNSQINQPVINGQQRTPQTVTWGEGTTDEMCITALLYAPAL